MPESKYEKSFAGKKNGKQYKVYCVLKDKNWHCRECEYEHVGTTQIAGSGGIKGLRNGTKDRDGLIIESINRDCKTCRTKTRQDRWTGKFEPATPVGVFSPSFSKRVFALLQYQDVVEMTTRPPSQLTIDHKLPRIRWDAQTEKEQNDYAKMDDKDIFGHFQLLKKSNGAVSHNLLKSRACENCFKTGLRGTPFNIRFFYAGTERWEPSDKKNPEGCIGCGWFDFSKWREELNIWLEIIGESG